MAIWNLQYLKFNQEDHYLHAVTPLSSKGKSWKIGNMLLIWHHHICRRPSLGNNSSPSSLQRSQEEEPLTNSFLLLLLLWYWYCCLSKFSIVFLWYVWSSALSLFYSLFYSLLLPVVLAQQLVKLYASK